MNVLDHDTRSAYDGAIILKISLLTILTAYEQSKFLRESLTIRNETLKMAIL